MARITDTEEISNHLFQIKQATDHGYYGPVADVVLKTNGSGDTLDVTVDYPDADNEVFSLSIPEYWEDGRTLPSILDTLDVPVDDISQIEDRSVPVQRTNGSWEVDMDRLNDGDYLVGNNYVNNE